MDTEKTTAASTQAENSPVFSEKEVTPEVTMLIGSYERSIDSKLRLVLPSQYRDKLEDHPLIMIRWLKRSLAIFPECNWIPMATRISKLQLYTDQGLTVRHQFFAHAREIKIDKKEGRIVIPPDMVEYGRLYGKLMILGDWDKITIWNYTYYLDQLAMDDVKMSECFPDVLQLANGQMTLEEFQDHQKLKGAMLNAS